MSANLGMKHYQTTLTSLDQFSLQVPLHLRNSWDSYYLELLMLAAVASYLLNYMNGKAKNQRLATAWLNCHRELLESNFSLVGT